MWEEPPISGTNGSGAVFFSYCNLKCVFCQNYDISTKNHGYYVSEEELADIFLGLEKQGAHNINLVTPTHFAPCIAGSIVLAKQKGLSLPVIYNCGGYENADTVKKLGSLIDIYMPDIKYFRNATALKYSGAPDYFSYASRALHEMVKQTGKCRFNENGIMQSGTLVRHMLLPGLIYESKKIIDYLYSTYGDDIYISIMSQYTPAGNLEEFPELNRTVDPRHYDSLINYCMRLGIKNAYIQSSASAKEEFIPGFYPYDK